MQKSKSTVVCDVTVWRERRDIQGTTAVINADPVTMGRQVKNPLSLPTWLQAKKQVGRKKEAWDWRGWDYGQSGTQRRNRRNSIYRFVRQNKPSSDNMQNSQEYYGVWLADAIIQPKELINVLWRLCVFVHSCICLRDNCFSKRTRRMIKKLPFVFLA